MTGLFHGDFVTPLKRGHDTDRDGAASKVRASES